MAGVRLHPVGSVIAGFLLTPLQGWVWALRSLSSAPLLPEFLLFWTEDFDSSYLLQGELGKEAKKEEDVGSGMPELCFCA